MKTPEEITQEIWRLKLISPRLPKGFICDNRKAVQAEIETLQTGRCPDWIYSEEDEDESLLEVISCAQDAKAWLEGKSKNAPSKNWGDLIEFFPEPVDALEISCGVPASNWVGQCASVAKALQKSGLPLGKGTTYHYGHWTGPIAPQSHFKERPFTHHAWLQKDDQIIDPTRWVFESCEPYIYVGQNDHYDDGGQSLDMQRIGQAPKPEGPAYLPRPENSDALAILEAEGITEEKLTRNQAHHLANLPPNAYPKIAAIHQWLKAHSLTALIPIDYQRIAQETAQAA
jgi:hypothetical protein